MNDVGVASQYKDLAGQFKAIPVAKRDLIDIDRYAVEKSLDGLVVVLVDEDRTIRTNPAARVTDPLKRVLTKAGFPSLLLHGRRTTPGGLFQHPARFPDASPHPAT